MAEYDGWSTLQVPQQKKNFKQSFQERMNKIAKQPGFFQKFMAMIFTREVSQYILEDSSEEKIKLTELKKQLEKEVSDFIKEKDEKKLSFIIKRGYQINNQQCVAIMADESSFSSDVIKNAVDAHLKNDFIHYLIGQFKGIDCYEEAKHCYHALYSRKQYCEHIAHDIKQVAGLAHCMWSRINMEEVLADDDIALQFLDACIHIKKTVVETKFLGRKDFQDSLELFITTIEYDKADAIEERFLKKMDKYSALLDTSFDRMTKNIASETASNIRNFKEHQLPQESRNLIKTIHKLYQGIKHESLGIEENLKLQNLYSKRLPQVLEEYITISPYYKEKLIAHNEAPDSLLLDSLNKVKLQIEEISDNLEHTKLNKMKSTNRYLGG